tara:strand:+ start:114 stop:1409 length:1296 start_codon:yes stop_codon:yes gene_type:complete
MNIDELFQLCTANKSYDKTKAITGGKIRCHVVDPYATYCEFFVSPELKDEISEFGRKLINWGNEVEKNYVESLQPGLTSKTCFFNEGGVRNSLQDCLNGDEFIYNPPLFYLDDDLAGKADLLRKDESHPSNFGDHHYIVEEIKFSKDFHKYDKSHYLYQGVFYNYLLGLIQGYTPEIFYMVDRMGNRNEFIYSNYESGLMTILDGIREIKNGNLFPIPEMNKCEKAYWKGYAKQKAIEDNNLSLIVDLYHGAKKNAENNGVRTVSEFAQFKEGDVSNLFKTPKPVRDKFLLANAQAINENKNKIINSLPSEFTHYDNYIFMDVEDSGWIHPDLPHYVFLIGVTVFDGSESYFNSFVALNENDESQMFDKYFGFSWRQEDVDALESMVLFWDAYENKCDDEKDERIKKIIDYNEDDCNSMLYIFDWMNSNLD